MILAALAFGVGIFQVNVGDFIGNAAAILALGSTAVSFVFFASNLATFPESALAEYAALTKRASDRDTDWSWPVLCRNR